MSKSIYDIIKRQNGEAFAKAIRRFDSGIFDIPNLPEIVKFAGRNARPLLPFLESLKKVEIKEVETGKSPFQLLEEAGYDAFYVDSLEKQNSIQKYFAKGEELCTFKDEKRYQHYHIIHCVKKGADKLKRSDFKGKEQREDEYGSSVISIQILKNGGFIKICNRYNHRVQSPDNTFSSNPDNIIYGLTKSIEKYLNVSLNAAQGMADGYTYQNGQIFKFHTELQNTYIGDGFCVKNGRVKFFNKDYEIVADMFIFNLKDKFIYTPLSFLHEDQSVLIDVLRDEIKDAKLQLVKREDGRHSLLRDGRPFLILNKGAIEELTLEKDIQNSVHLDMSLLSNLKKLTLKNVRKVGYNFLSNNTYLEEFIAPKLETAFSFFMSGTRLKKVYLPRLRQVGECSFQGNELLEELDLPLLKCVGSESFTDNPSLIKLSLNSLIDMPELSMMNNDNLTTVSMKSLKYVGHSSFSSNLVLERLSLNKVGFIDDATFCNMPALKELEMRSLVRAAGGVFIDLPLLKVFRAPKLEDLGMGSCLSKTGLEYLFLPSLEWIDNNALKRNPFLKSVYFPRLNVSLNNPYARKKLSCFVKWPVLIRAKSGHLIPKNDKGYVRD